MGIAHPFRLALCAAAVALAAAVGLGQAAAEDQPYDLSGGRESVRVTPSLPQPGDEVEVHVTGCHGTYAVAESEAFVAQAKPAPAVGGGLSGEARISSSAEAGTYPVEVSCHGEGEEGKRVLSGRVVVAPPPDRGDDGGRGGTGDGAGSDAGHGADGGGGERGGKHGAGDEGGYEQGYEQGREQDPEEGYEQGREGGGGYGAEGRDEGHGDGYGEDAGPTAPVRAGGGGTAGGADGGNADGAGFGTGHTLLAGALLAAAALTVWRLRAQAG